MDVGARKIHWDPTSHSIFLDCCIEEVNKGNRPGSHFNRTGWRNLVSNFNTRAGRNYNKVQLKNHWDAMKKDWKMWDKLMRMESGIGWDPVRKTIDASPQWWEEKIRADPDLAKFKDKNLEMYKMYYDPLFRDTVATGDRAMAPSELPPAPDAQNAPQDEFGTCGDDSGDSMSESDEEGSDDGGGPVLRGGIRFPESSLHKRPGNDQPSTSRRRKTRATPNTVWKQQLDTVLEALKHRSTPTYAPPREDLTVTECTRMLEGLPGVTVGSRFWYEACVLFWRKEVRIGFASQPTNETKVEYMKFVLEKMSCLPPLPGPPTV